MENLSVSKIVQNIPQAMSIKFNMMVYDLQRQGKDIIVLSAGEAFFKIPLFSFRALTPKIVTQGYHYSSSRGLPELRKIISNYYFKEYGVKSDPDTEILVSVGSKPLIYMAIAVILNPGEEVIIFEPAWVSYTEQVRIAHGIPVTVPYYEGIYDLKKYLTKKTKAIIINNPNNPSGKVYSKKELLSLYNFAKKHNLYIISDEAYSDFVLNEPFISMGYFDKKKERIFILNTFSKNLGMSGWRIGYVITNDRLVNLILKLNQHLITCPTTLIEYYLIKYFDKIISTTRPQIKKIVEKRSAIAKFMDKIGLKYLPGSGTFYFCVSIDSSKLTSEEFATRLLKEYFISTVPGIGYGKSLDKFLRVGIGIENISRIKKSLLSISQLINETKI